MSSGPGPAAFLVACVASAGALACCTDRAEVDDSAAGSLTARGVTLEVPAGQQTLTARGRRLELRDAGTELLLTGDTRVELGGPSRLEARADRLRVSTDGPVVELSGNVHAVLHAPGRNAADGGS